MKKVLVTGSGGFVGRVLTSTLQANGYEIWGVDRRPDPDGAPDRMITADLNDKKAVDKVLDDIQPDSIVHLAAQASAGQSFDEPHFTIQNNLLPVLHILESLRLSGASTRLLVVGSAEVYGPVIADELPLSEAHAPNPVSPYALSKWLQEQCCTQYAARYGTDVVMTRSFNHTGAGQSDTFALPSFARQIVDIKKGKGEPEVAVGNIEVRRDFLDVRDVCRAYQLLLERGKSGAVYNVCSGISWSLRDMLRKLAKFAGVDVTFRVDEGRMRPVDIEDLRGDNTNLITDTGWERLKSIDDMLQALIEYWSENDTKGEESK